MIRFKARKIQAAKKATKTSPTQRTLKYLRDLGYSVDKVEHWNAFARRRVDAFDFIDILALKLGSPGVLGVQTTTTSNMGARVRKAKIIPEMKLWIQCGNPLWIIGWSKKGPSGKQKLWTASIKELTVDDLDSKELEEDYNGM